MILFGRFLGGLKMFRGRTRDNWFLNEISSLIILRVLRKKYFLMRAFDYILSAIIKFFINFTLEELRTNFVLVSN